MTFYAGQQDQDSDISSVYPDRFFRHLSTESDPEEAAALIFEPGAPDLFSTTIIQVVEVGGALLREIAESNPLIDPEVLLSQICDEPDVYDRVVEQVLSRS